MGIEMISIPKAEFDRLESELKDCKELSTLRFQAEQKFHWKVLELEADLAKAKQINALNGESIKEGRKENARLRRALVNIVLILGPTIPDCCEGGRAEMAGALELASEALKQ